MSNEERIARLWGQVRNFRIVVAGDGNIEGGFGSLSATDDLDEKLDKIESAVAKFRLGGNGVNVSGSFDQGFILT